MACADLMVFVGSVACADRMACAHPRSCARLAKVWTDVGPKCGPKLADSEDWFCPEATTFGPLIGRTSDQAFGLSLLSVRYDCDGLVGPNMADTIQSPDSYRTVAPRTPRQVTHGEFRSCPVCAVEQFPEFVRFWQKLANM